MASHLSWRANSCLPWRPGFGIASRPPTDGGRPRQAGRLRVKEVGSGARTRTVNLAVNSRLLYRLSYSGVAREILPGVAGPGSRLPVALRRRLGVAAAVQLRQKPLPVAGPTAPACVPQALVLGEDVHESVAHVVAVVVEQAPPLGALLDDLPDGALRTELRHQAEPPSPPPRGGRASAPAPAADRLPRR